MAESERSAKPFLRPRRSWALRFADAMRGIAVGVKGQPSCYVHLATGLAVVALAAALKVSYLEWCVLVVCIVMVLGAELLNGAIEQLARAVDECENARLRDSLDIASGAVLTVAAGAAITGGIIFLRHLWMM